MWGKELGPCRRSTVQGQRSLSSDARSAPVCGYHGWEVHGVWRMKIPESSRPMQIFSCIIHATTQTFICVDASPTSTESAFILWHLNLVYIWCATKKGMQPLTTESHHMLQNYKVIRDQIGLSSWLKSQASTVTRIMASLCFNFSTFKIGTLLILAYLFRSLKVNLKECT